MTLNREANNKIDIFNKNMENIISQKSKANTGLNILIEYNSQISYSLIAGVIVSILITHMYIFC